MKEFFRFLLMMSIGVLTIMILVSLLVLPAMYFGGKGRAAYLKQTQGIDLTWYEAAAIEVKSGSADIKLENVK